MVEQSDTQNHKSFRSKKSGRKVKMKKNNADLKNRNPKAFAVKSVQKMAKQFRRSQDIKSKKLHIPVVNRTPLEPPPIIVCITGPPKVGKTTLLRSLVKNYTRVKLNDICGPVTVIASKRQRVTFLEVGNDINSMIDAAKIADLVLLLIDASYGFEMETFEFLNIAQVHGMPKVIGVLTHLDLKKDNKALRKSKKRFKHRFWTEVYQGAKLFYLSGLMNNEYLKREVHNLARFISITKFRPLTWRSTHPYLLCDRLEDITNPDDIRANPKCNRKVCFYGYMRGIPLQNDTFVHLAGVGDFRISDISFLSDPCPFPNVEKKRSLNYKERLLYAPLSGVGGIVYDKDAIYIDVGGSHSHDNNYDQQGNSLSKSLAATQHTIDEKLDLGVVSVFRDAEIPTPNSHDDSSFNRRPVLSLNDKINENDSEDALTSDSEGDDSDDNNSKTNDSFEISSEKYMDVDYSDVDDETSNRLKLAEIEFVKRAASVRNISSIIYESDTTRSNRETTEFGGMFTIREDSSEIGHNGVDSSIVCNSRSVIDLSNDVLQQFLINCFVTGKWGDEEDAETLLKQEDDLYGDFEDLEEKSQNVEVCSESKTPDAAVREENAAKKIKSKQKFDFEYDNKDDGDDYFTSLKASMSAQAEMNLKEFEGMDDARRVKYEGFRAGMYVRLELQNVPSEFVQNFDASYPLLIGGLLSQENSIGYIQSRIKKHRWYKRILKSRDPVIVSLGWRRFQTISVYYMVDHNMRNRLLKYTPMHMHCNCTMFGPLTPQGTGFICLQNIRSDDRGYRIIATGTVLELNKSTDIEKKLKLVGYPVKIYRNTAFIRGMFSSILEVAKFEGAIIKTVSGIRGCIKKAIKSPEGAFRASFEDRVKLSDIVFLRTWYRVDVPKLYTPVTNLLSPASSRSFWSGMRTVGTLRHELGIGKPDINKDSLYKSITRIPQKYNELKISGKLQKQLPFKNKPKYERITKSKVATVREPREKKIMAMLETLRGVQSEKNRVRNEKKLELLQKRQKLLDKLDNKRKINLKRTRTKVFKNISKHQKRSSNK